MNMSLQTLNTAHRIELAKLSAAPDEAQIDAQLAEVEASIQELQKKRAELLRSKGAIRWAKTKGSGPSPAQPTAAPPSPTANLDMKAVEKALSELEWSSFKKKEGEWTFLRKRDGTLVDALAPQTDFVNQLKKRETVVGKYRYSVSEDKFLNRHFNE